MRLRGILLPLLGLGLAIVPTLFGLGYVIYDLVEGTIVVEDLPFAVPTIALGYAMIVLALQRFSNGMLRGVWARTSGVVAAATTGLGIFAGALLIPTYDLGIMDQDFLVLVLSPVVAGGLYAFLALESRWFETD